MNSTWQRIIKAGKGILEIARERGQFEFVDVTEDLTLKCHKTLSTTAGYVLYENGDYSISFTVSFSGREDIDVEVEALNHLEEIAQALEEALEIWRKM